MTPAWEKSCRDLLAYREKHGHCNVPTGDSSCVQLGRWVAAQRHKRRRGDLSPEEIERLDEAQFEWDPTENAWATMFGRLKAYASQRGDCNLPEHYPEDQKLANWVHSQRHKRRKGVLPEDREKKLSSIGFCWSVYTGKTKPTAADAVAAKSASPMERTEYDEEKLYCLRQGVYVQHNGKGELPAALVKFMQVNGGEMPAYIPLPHRPTIFIVGDGYWKDRMCPWPGKGPLPGAVLEYVAENGHLPRHE
jgi:hypothetical protein